MTGNMQIVHPDGLPQLFQGGTNSAIVLSRLGVIGKHFETTAKIVDSDWKSNSLSTVIDEG